jgi:[ribosomal protein S5]-alanine N-acetyltransferase
MDILQTPRLDLLPATSEFLKHLIAEDYTLAGELLDVTVPEGWPFEAAPRAGLSIHLAAIEEDPSEYLWRIRLIVLRSARTVVGSINLKGPPERKGGTVEIGWGVSFEYRRQGIAREAAQAVIDWVLSQPGVRRVIATIPDDNLASKELAKRLGMRYIQEIHRNLPVWELSL